MYVVFKKSYIKYKPQLIITELGEKYQLYNFHKIGKYQLSCFIFTKLCLNRLQWVLIQKYF